MSALSIVTVVLVLAVAGFFLGRARALSSAGGDSRAMHSRPIYYGANVFLFTALPALSLLALWLILQPLVLGASVSGRLSDEVVSVYGSRNLAMSDVRRVANGLDRAVQTGAMTPEAAASMRTEFTDVRARLGELGVALGSNVRPEILRAAQVLRTSTATWNRVRAFAVIGLALAGLAFSVLRTSRDFRARNAVEQGTLVFLLLCATVAILTTIGIVVSLLGGTWRFFEVYPAAEFFFGTTWSPSFGGGSRLGIVPLLWGTLYISAIALVVAVPIGLFSAIYLSEYASPRVRSVIKPALEVLAGIPSIVYGLFALLTVGPILLSIFGPNGTGWMSGTRAVMTAGLVMGIMNIPFVSSLSDDIINAVPQSLRDGSLGLGATRSETIRQVVLPAALPGIVGAVILAASRCIGETMLVVLGAGAAGALSLNPFEAMTTVTAKIVSQLTGDADFSSPEALVAFALGTTLFVLTLGLNAIALVIVRKYREQYE